MCITFRRPYTWDFMKFTFPKTLNREMNCNLTFNVLQPAFEVIFSILVRAEAICSSPAMEHDKKCFQGTEIFFQVPQIPSKLQTVLHIGKQCNRQDRDLHSACSRFDKSHVIFWMY